MPRGTTAKSERTRRLIIEKSASLFNRKGVAGTSLGDILEVTGLSKGGVYGNFDSKEEIALAAFEHAVGLITARVHERTRHVEHTLDKFKTVVYFYKEHILDPPVAGGCPIQNMAVEADDTHLTLREKVKAALDHWQQRIIHTVEKGQERGEIRADADARDFAVRFIATLEGGILLSRLYRDPACFDPVARQLLDLIGGLAPAGR